MLHIGCKVRIVIFCKVLHNIEVPYTAKSLTVGPTVADSRLAYAV